MFCTEQAVHLLWQAMDNAEQGKHQFLSGLLHNLAKLLSFAAIPYTPLAALKAAGYGPGTDMITFKICLI